MISNEMDREQSFYTVVNGLAEQMSAQLGRMLWPRVEKRAFGVWSVEAFDANDKLYMRWVGSLQYITDLMHDHIKELSVLNTPKPTPTKWASRLLDAASLAASWSKDTTKVGAVLTDNDGKVVLLTAFNGPAMGVKDLNERFDRTNGEKYFWAEHAEQNLISFAARKGIATEGMTVVCTHFPCSRCAGILVQAGVKRVIVGGAKTNMPEREFEVARTKFKEANVEVVDFE